MALPLPALPEFSASHFGYDMEVLAESILAQHFPGAFPLRSPGSPGPADYTIIQGFRPIALVQVKATTIPREIYVFDYPPDLGRIADMATRMRLPAFFLLMEWPRHVHFDQVWSPPPRRIT